MKFMMFVCVDPTADNTETDVPADADNPTMPIEAWVEEMDRRAARLDGEVLVPAKEAKTVRLRGNRQLVTDGPYADTKELIAGFDILDCTDLNEAIEIAAKHPMARNGAIELRQFSALDD